MESAFTEVQLIAHDQETIDRAHLLTSIARRIAVARAVHGAGGVPSDLDESLFVAERAFVNSARRDLGLRSVNAPPFPDALWQIDVDLLQAYRDRNPGSPPDSSD
ncbi:hypothetical protein ACFV0T_30130 [Streptomyces sp. NPDC059582]|uniref:hypothetical protein n=1 Tax=Streptomyces sp. NPDC059582 TaxID=3346875 RepID=UPI0036958469